jgi:hypothetical protein
MRVVYRCLVVWGMLKSRLSCVLTFVFPAFVTDFALASLITARPRLAKLCEVHCDPLCFNILKLNTKGTKDNPKAHKGLSQQPLSWRIKKK